MVDLLGKHSFLMHQTNIGQVFGLRSDICVVSHHVKFWNLCRYPPSVVSHVLELHHHDILYFPHVIAGHNVGFYVYFFVKNDSAALAENVERNSDLESAPLT